VQHGCPIALVHSNSYLDEVICRWPNILKTLFIVDGIAFTTLLFADYQTTAAEFEDKLQESTRKYNLNIFSKKTAARLAQWCSAGLRG